MSKSAFLANGGAVPADASHVRPDALSFIKRKRSGGDGYDYWTVENTGDYDADCKRGKELGAEYLAFVGKYPTNGSRALLASIVDSMMVKRSAPNTHWGRHATGLEIGFMTAVNEYALATAAILANQSETAA